MKYKHDLIFRRYDVCLSKYGATIFGLKYYLSLGDNYIEIYKTHDTGLVVDFEAVHRIYYSCGSKEMGLVVGVMEFILFHLKRPYLCETNKKN